MNIPERKIGEVWQSMAESEVRSLYFAALSARYHRRKQIILGTQLFLASGAAASIGASVALWLPLLLSTATAALTAYTIASALDKRVLISVKLHCEWSRIAAEYESIWYAWSSDDADERLRRVKERDIVASQECLELGPYDKKLSDEWSDVICALPASMNTQSQTPEEKRSWPPVKRPPPPPPTPPAKPPEKKPHEKTERV